jgi:hypothetical protein
MEFRIHEDARAEWDRLRALWGDVESRRWLRALVEWLRAHDGVPPDAVPDTRVRPTIYWLLFGEVGVEYTLREAPPAPRGWWDVVRYIVRWRRGRTRRVIFNGFDLPGYPPLPAPLPH